MVGASMAPSTAVRGPCLRLHLLAVVWFGSTVTSVGAFVPGASLRPLLRHGHGHGLGQGVSHGHGHGGRGRGFGLPHGGGSTGRSGGRARVGVVRGLGGKYDGMTNEEIAEAQQKELWKMRQDMAQGTFRTFINGKEEEKELQAAKVEEVRRVTSDE